MWVPLTECADGSAMRVADQPSTTSGIGSEGREPPSAASKAMDDPGMHALPSRNGAAASFYGHRLAYGGAINTTELTTVSLDFHVIPFDLYQERPADSRRSSHDLRLGGYYSVICLAEPEASDGGGVAVGDDITSPTTC